VVLDLPSEFPQVDERFMTMQYEWLFLNVFILENIDGNKNIFHGLNGLAMHNSKTGKTRFFHAGDDSPCQEPIFIPRSDDAVEGDSWVMTLVERRAAGTCDVAILDTRQFEKLVVLVQLLIHVKPQIHGSWVPAAALKTKKSLVREMSGSKISRRGALEPLD
jgi:carotenoid cleavage dioxygenase-like enzyme